MKAGLFIFACLFSFSGRAWSQSRVSLLASENIAHHKFSFQAVPGSAPVFNPTDAPVENQSQYPEPTNNLDVVSTDVPMVSTNLKPEVSVGWNQNGIRYFKEENATKNTNLLENYLQNRNLQYPAYQSVNNDLPLSLQVLQTGSINSLAITLGIDQNTFNILVPVFIQGFVALTDERGTEIKRLAFRGSETSMDLNFGKGKFTVKAITKEGLVKGEATILVQ